MEASEAGAAETQGAQTQAPEQAPAGPDLSPVLDRFNDMERSFGDRFEQLESRFTDPEGAQEQGLFVDETGQLVDQYGQPLEGQAAQGQPPDADQLRGQLRQELMQELSPMLDQVQEHFTNQEYAQLEDKYEKLRDSDFSDKIVEAADEKAAALAQAVGNPDLAGKLATSPGFLELMYLAQEAQQAAKSETPADRPEQDFQVETAGGNPGGGELDEGDRIVQATTRGGDFFG